jgi:arabinofuranosyltransferase
MSRKPLFSAGFSRLLGQLPAVLFFWLFTLAFIATAWLAEDAFITFRVVANALHGFGLVWNVGERVQAYTHPLWFFLLAATSAICRIPPTWAAFGLGFLCLLANLGLMRKIAKPQSLAPWLCLFALLFSRSFIDWSSSGLENPLTHLLLLGFLAIFLFAPEKRALPWLALFSGLLYLCRPDAAVLAFPALFGTFWQAPESLGKKARQTALGLLPLFAWEAFSLFYYGALLPNTAIAKVFENSLSLPQAAANAWLCLDWTARYDWPGMALLLAGCAICLWRPGKTRLVGIGFLLWLGYFFWVGGDYMAGRFFSAPICLAATLLAFCLQKQAGPCPEKAAGTRFSPKKAAWPAALLLLSMPAAPQLRFTLFSPADFSWRKLEPHGRIIDTRSADYQNGLLPMAKPGWKPPGWMAAGFALRRYPPRLYVSYSIGMSAWAAGPEFLFLDPLGLADPFLARLPATPSRLPGHYVRALPPGYLESRLYGQNRLKDPALAALYADVQLATRAPLLDKRRAGAIWRLNSGFYRKLQKAIPAGSFKPEFDPRVENCYPDPGHVLWLWSVEKGKPWRMRMAACFLGSPAIP